MIIIIILSFYVTLRLGLFFKKKKKELKTKAFTLVTKKDYQHSPYLMILLSDLSMLKLFFFFYFQDDGMLQQNAILPNSGFIVHVLKRL